MTAITELVGGLVRRALPDTRLVGDQLVVSVVAQADSPADGVSQLADLLDAVRAASTKPEAQKLGAAEGFRIEDVSHARLAAPPAIDAQVLRAWLGRRLPAGAEIVVDSRPGPLALAMALRPRTGFAPDRVRYQRQADGRVRVEAFELHPVEHCNLRCGNCCNMSPLVPKRWLSESEVLELAQKMASALVADVVKIMGGEPLLHPHITGVIRALRSSGVGDRVRLFTNGLLLASMDDDFWASLDELTISNYASAPVKPATLALARQKAKEHDIVLNIKPVDTFSQVLSPHYEPSDERTQRTFERCWLRHRCLVVRGRTFTMCTRAAYADEFLKFAQHEAPHDAHFDRSNDGIDIDAPQLAASLEAYLNRSQPLAACRYCLGGDGATEPHHQLSRAEVTRGVLSRRLTVV